ncbi:unnamed protein product [Allacma fusca]|uniref:Uncharacterized protein n=1 Tax=Allacma fusca TaxID=39272 RepID=A0A8J2L7N0_9HEXA|nr:unnamed protein product [Allacma fusca]
MQSVALLIRYLQRWAKDWMRELATSADFRPLHCPRQQCPCQYITDILTAKRNQAGCSLCSAMADSNPVIVP